MIDAAKVGAEKSRQMGSKAAQGRGIELQGRMPDELAAMAAERIRREGMGKGATPVADSIYGSYGPLNRAEMKQVQAADVQPVMPNNSQMFEALVNSDVVAPKRMLARGGAKVMDVLAQDSNRGDMARVAAVTGVTGGITASGAALIDLMKFLTQGQSVEANRDNVLSS